ncbi:hypothetical protein K7395_24680 [Streptomyces filamentosus]|uniref:Minor tail protein n=2 Tax=Streptomyces filamentosus TaxID=67294 RepID=A0ABY4V2C2_STRFL|nr:MULTISPECIES: hypothetical protein [Streptomyces]EFE74512.1 predicted protein [Streptomyces filamentosus NRRL 15998]ESU46506.1 hypothetical protein P376_5517 [Streptomyces sp. HCCB10043]EWS91682.1 hypothetical protein SSIG_02130 [Streptomyces filamentosus NRRL 11379]MYR78643.1 hypothetical protein [Streptomyces sp. SID5466]USC49685.1 hypothetical protein K7395_24680 [Streptomyces filamentosus]
MAQSSWPSPSYNDRSVTDAEYEVLSARFSDNGVYGDPTDPAVVTEGVGLSVNVRPGVNASVRGHAWTSGTSTLTLAVAANGSSSTRTDRAILRLDRSDWTVRAVIKQGLPGSGVPTLTQQTGGTGVFEVLLANITVPPAATSVSVTRGERYVGTRVRPCTSTPLTDPNPVLGELRWETDAKRLSVYDGEELRTLHHRPDQMVIDSPFMGWSNETASVLEVRGGVACLRLGSFQRTSRALDHATNSRLPVMIPAAYRHPNRDQFGIVYITGAHIGRVTVMAKNNPLGGQVYLTQHPDIDVGDRVLSSTISWVVDH